MIPYIKEGDFGLSESNAILKYLCNTHDKIPEHYWPKNLQERFRVDQFLEYNQFHFRPALVGSLRLRMGAQMHKVTFTQDVLDFTEQNLKLTLETFEKLLAQYEGAFVATDKLTIADL